MMPNKKSRWTAEVKYLTYLGGQNVERTAN